MVLEEQYSTPGGYHQYGSNESLAAAVPTTSDAKRQSVAVADGPPAANAMKINERELEVTRSFKMPYQQSFRESDWSQLAEATLPLKTSRYLSGAIEQRQEREAGQRRLSSPSNLVGASGTVALPLRAGQATYGGLGGPVNSSPLNSSPLAGSYQESLPLGDSGMGPTGEVDFESSCERRARHITRRLILVNLISLLVNLLLALVAFYFSFVNNSSSTTAFAADCVLDLISSAIVLWRYYGDLSDVYMHAREQIACIYLGALFELSALGIIIKASSDIASGVDPSEPAPGYDLIYLAAAATVACSVLIVFKWHLYETIRDKSILLDVINTFVSTIFAVTLCLMTVLSNVDSSFWYFDPVLSIVLALFMAGFGLKVIHQNFHVLRPSYCTGAGHGGGPLGGSPFAKLPLLNRDEERMGLVGDRKLGAGRGQYETNLNASVENARANWQKTDYSSIAFV